MSAYPVQPNYNQPPPPYQADPGYPPQPQYGNTQPVYVQPSGGQPQYGQPAYGSTQPQYAQPVGQPQYAQPTGQYAQPPPGQAVQYATPTGQYASPLPPGSYQPAPMQGQYTGATGVMVQQPGVVVQQPVIVVGPGVIPYQNWKVDACEACCAAPGTCCFAMFCPCVVAYQQRELLIGPEPNPYFCCNRQLYGNCCGDCPRVPCLCLEVTCCLGLAIVGNRRTIQRLHHIQPNCLEDCLIVCISGNGNGCSGGGHHRHALNCIVHLACMALSGCYQTQQAIQLDPTKGPEGKPIDQVMK